MTAAARVEAAPLRRVVSATIHRHGLAPVVDDMAERFGAPRTTVERRVLELLSGRYATVSFWWGDRMACACGRHPSELWPEAFMDEDDAGDDIGWE